MEAKAIVVALSEVDPSDHVVLAELIVRAKNVVKARGL
jgi:hypothetical protein